MQFGVCLPNFPFGVRPSRDAILEVAQVAEQVGYDSVWATDHILVPKDKPRFSIVYESLSTLAYLGGATEKIQLGTSILVLPYRNAITVAKQTATVDALTGGRLILGVAVGWMEQEFEHLGADYRRRGRILDEQLAVLRTLWTDDDPHLDGQFYRFSDVLFQPRPARPGGIPIWVGGNSNFALRRTARLGDAWHADDLRPDQLSESIDKLRAMTEGREVDVTLRRTVDLRPAMAAAASGESDDEPAGPWPGASELALTGSLAAVESEIDTLMGLGLAHFVCQFEHETQEEHLQQMRFFAQHIFPRLHD
jgi:probable F420-dependent oxidoreductase